jgi:hypothetical protein
MKLLKIGAANVKNAVFRSKNSKNPKNMLYNIKKYSVRSKKMPTFAPDNLKQSFCL